MPRIQIRRGDNSLWSAANPILNAGEFGFETTNDILKIGDGVTHWADLPALALSTDIISDLSNMTGDITPDQMPSGAALTIDFTSTNYTTLARPTSLADIRVFWFGDATVDSTMTPTNSLPGDPVFYNAAL